MVKMNRKRMAEICYFCLEGEGKDLIKCCTCECSWAHRSCLNRWRFESINPKALTKCTICLNKYKYEIDKDKEQIVKIKYYFAIFRDIGVLLSVLSLSIFLAYLYVSDKFENDDLSLIFTELVASTQIILFLIFFMYLSCFYIYNALFCDTNFISRPYFLSLMCKRTPWIMLIIVFIDVPLFLFVGSCEEGDILYCIWIGLLISIVSIILMMIVLRNVLKFHFRKLRKNYHVDVYQVMDLRKPIP